MGKTSFASFFLPASCSTNGSVSLNVSRTYLPGFMYVFSIPPPHPSSLPFSFPPFPCHFPFLPSSLAEDPPSTREEVLSYYNERENILNQISDDMKEEKVKWKEKKRGEEGGKEESVGSTLSLTGKMPHWALEIEGSGKVRSAPTVDVAKAYTASRHKLSRPTGHCIHSHLSIVQPDGGQT